MAVEANKVPAKKATILGIIVLPEANSEPWLAFGK
jgi:hypothetical protein